MIKHHWARTYVLNFYKRPFIILLQTPYLSTGRNLSWVEPATVRLVASSRDQDTIHQKSKGSKVNNI